MGSASSNCNGCHIPDEVVHCFETITVGGSLPYFPPYFPPDLGAGVGNGGVSGGDSAGNSQGEVDGKEECEIKALEVKGDCVTIANALGRTGAAACAGFYPNVPAIITCEIVNGAAWDDQLNTCDVNYERDKATCD